MLFNLVGNQIKSGNITAMFLTVSGSVFSFRLVGKHKDVSFRLTLLIVTDDISKYNYCVCVKV